MTARGSKIVLGLAAVCLCGLAAAPAAAQYWWWPPGMSVPQCPNVEDTVAVSVGGDWPDACIPNGSDIWVVDDEVHFIVILDYPPGTVCAQVITPWSLSESVGPLPAGTYAVYATLYHTYYGQQMPPTLLGMLTVSDTSHVGDMNCDGVVNALDVDPFVLALTDAVAYETEYPCCPYELADCNSDGLVNTFDIDPFVELLAGG